MNNDGVTKDLIEDLKEMLIKNEGMKLHPYLCTANKMTIGVGRNLSDNGITSAEAEQMLSNDMDNVFSDLDRNIPFWQSLPYNIRLVLCDMAFNLGIKKLCKFHFMLEALEERNFELAAEELLDSTYAKQVKNRAKRNYDLILEDC
ncbi:MAG: putative endolysin [Prokaryotic dsDNA virus sp.]|jgi:lysozyme|nr:MAG: putative endolysin [Prokaryotic dsDNA virus sp.]|tara:strand:+ start:2246 stop:2683 length:438 start_codon:yes stop_codon:yes gene_type:complete